MKFLQEIFLYIILFSTPLTLLSQISHNEAIKATNDKSFVSLYNIDDNLNNNPIEMKVVNDFYFRFGADKRVALAFHPRAYLRMYFENNFRTLSPTFCPDVSVYYRLFTKKNFKVRYYEFKPGYITNAMSDPFLNEDSTINYQTGKFNTMFIDVSYNKARPITLKKNTLWSVCYKYWARYYMPNEMEDALKDRFDNIQAGMEVHVFNNYYKYWKGPKTDTYAFNNSPLDIHLTAKACILFENFTLDRLKQGKTYNVNLNLSVRPLKKMDYFVFFEFYYGADYYNLFFDESIYIYRLGVIANPVALSIFN